MPELRQATSLNFYRSIVSKITVKKYRIIYRISAGKVYILTIHHSAKLLESNDTFRDLLDE